MVSKYSSKLFNQLNDVRLIADGKAILAHKNILCAASDVFEKMFTVDMKEKKESRVVIDDLNYDVVVALIKYIYTETLDGLTDDVMVGLIMAGDKYNMDDLVEGVIENIEITVDNSLELYSSLKAIPSVQYSVTSLKKDVLAFIIANGAAIKSTNGYQQMCGDYKNMLLNDLLDHSLPKKSKLKH